MKDTRRRRYAIVTGASRGIGAEYARALATQGYDLLLVARDRDRLEQLAWELRSAYDVQVHFEVMDLSESDAAQRLYVASRQRGEHVDLLINNAGFGLFGPFTDLPMRRIQEMLRLQVATVVETMRLFLPGMVDDPRAPLLTLRRWQDFSHSRSWRSTRQPRRSLSRFPRPLPKRYVRSVCAFKRVVRAAPTRISIARPDSRPTIPWGAIRLPTLWRFRWLPYRGTE